MDTGSLGYPCISDNEIRVTPLWVDSFTEKICVVECIREKDGKRPDTSEQVRNPPLKNTPLQRAARTAHPKRAAR